MHPTISPFSFPFISSASHSPLGQKNAPPLFHAATTQHTIAPFKYSTSLPPRSISPPKHTTQKQGGKKGKGVLRHRKEERRAPYSAEAKRISLLFFLRCWSRYGRRRREEEGPSKSLTSPLFSNTACGHATRNRESIQKIKSAKKKGRGRRRVLINGPLEKR